MVKRLGANGRKRNADRKVKVKSAAKKAVARTMIIICIAAIGIVLSFGGYKGIIQIVKSVQQSEAFDVTAVAVQGNKHVETKSIIDKCGFGADAKTYSVREASVREALMSNPWIENVNVSKSFDGKVCIKIKERKPVALVNLSRIYYIDRSGVVFPLAKKVISEMPILYGLKDTIDNHGIRRIRTADMLRVKSFMREALAVNNDFFQSITQIDFSDKNKIRLSFQDYSTLVELSGENLEIKLRQLIRLEKIVQNDEVMPQKIDLSYQNIAVVTVPDTLIEE